MIIADDRPLCSDGGAAPQNISMSRAKTNYFAFCVTHGSDKFVRELPAGTKIKALPFFLVTQ